MFSSMEVSNVAALAQVTKLRTSLLSIPNIPSMTRHALLPRLIFARWLQLGIEQGGDHGLGTCFLLWFGDMITMAALASVSRSTRKAITLLCGQCNKSWDFKGCWADPFWMKQLERLKNTCPGASDTLIYTQLCNMVTSLSSQKSPFGGRRAEGAACTSEPASLYTISTFAPWLD